MVFFKDAPFPLHSLLSLLLGNYGVMEPKEGGVTF